MPFGKNTNSLSFRGDFHKVNNKCNYWYYSVLGVKVPQIKNENLKITWTVAIRKYMVNLCTTKLLSLSLGGVVKGEWDRQGPLFDRGGWHDKVFLSKVLKRKGGSWTELFMGKWK